VIFACQKEGENGWEKDRSSKSRGRGRGKSAEVSSPAAHSLFTPIFITKMVTRAISRKDGTPAKSIKDFKKHRGR